MRKTVFILLALLLLAAMALSFAACGEKEEETQSNTQAVTDSGEAGIGGAPTGEYTITFDSMGGSPVASIRGAAGAELRAPDAPRKDGYEFLGWYESSDQGATLSENAFIVAVMPARNVTLYAKWAVLTEKGRTYRQTNLSVTWGSDEEKAAQLKAMNLTEEEMLTFFGAREVVMSFSENTVSFLSNGYSKTNLYYAIGTDGVMVFYESAEAKAEGVAYTGDGVFENIFIISADYQTIRMRMPFTKNSYMEYILSASGSTGGETTVGETGKKYAIKTPDTDITATENVKEIASLRPLYSQISVTFDQEGKVQLYLGPGLVGDWCYYVVNEENCLEFYETKEDAEAGTNKRTDDYLGWRYAFDAERKTLTITIPYSEGGSDAFVFTRLTA